ncbi:MAG: hypothetical protein Q7R30_16245 [Acidobacteriota bacterium]|nr:hypothetical protein [Acidobacteriota bacterium]
MPLTLCWPSPPKPGRTLFIAFAYHGADRDADRRGLLERFESASARGHRIVHRDHYANPRTLPYMISMIIEAADILSPHEQPDLVLDGRHQAGVPEEVIKSFGLVTVAPLVESAGSGHESWTPSGRYQHVVLVYPDALGLGCEAAESRALGQRGSVLVINGRRRMFTVRGSSRARLRLSRFLAHTRVVERAMGRAVRPLGAVLAAWDRAAGRSSA